MRFLRFFVAFCLLLPSLPVAHAEVFEGEPETTSDPPAIEEDQEELPEEDEPEGEEVDPEKESEVDPEGEDPGEEEDEEPEEELPEEGESAYPILFISEVLRGSEASVNDHFVELYNPNDEEVELLGWQMRGVTSGGGWIDITPDVGTAIQDGGHFVISRYTNSSSSVQSLIPGSIKSSLSIPEGDIFIELRDPDGIIVDTAMIMVEELEIGEETYHSYERLWPFQQDGEWTLSSGQTHLKENIEFTFATPGAENSDVEFVGEVTDLEYYLDVYELEVPEGEDPENVSQIYDLQLSWIPPEHDLLELVRLYQLDDDSEDKTLLSEFSVPEWGGEEPDFQEFWLFDIDPTVEMVFQVTTVDVYGQESEGEMLWVEPEIEYRVVINEILPDPKTADTQNEFIELRNLSPYFVDLYGWELDDGTLDNDNSYFFIDEMRDYVLEPGGFIVFDRYETEISLGNVWDEVYLFDDEGFEVDYYLYLPDYEGRSWARDHENPEEWFSLNHPTPGAPNIEFNEPPVPVIGLQGGSTYMNVNVTGEDSFDPQDDDFTYLWDFGDGTTSDVKNPTQHTYSTEGQKTITLTVIDEFGMSDFTTHIFNAAEKQTGQSSNDNSQNGQTGSQNDSSSADPIITYPDLELISEFIPNPEGKDTELEWIELLNDTDSTVDLSGWYLDDDEGGTAPYQIPDGTTLEPGEYLLFEASEAYLSLGNSEDSVRLLDPNNEVKQTISYSEVQENFSYARTSDGSFAWTSIFTPGEPNEFPPPPVSYPAGSVVFQKVFPNPEGKDDGLEKIVLKNTTNSPIDLEGWMMIDGQDHESTFSSLSIAPNFERELEQEEFEFGLNNNDETIFLYDPAGNLIDEISWENAPNDQWVFDLDVFEDGMSVTVLKTIDGDTFDIDWRGHTFRVRLIGVDTPETVHPFQPVEYYGQMASDYLKNLLSRKTVSLTFDETKMDKYGRLLAYVHLNDEDDRSVNLRIIEGGYGKAYTRFPFKELDVYMNSEEAARAAGLGMWTDPETAILIEEEMDKIIELEIEEDMSEEDSEEISADQETKPSGVVFEVGSEDQPERPETEDEQEENSEKDESIPMRDCIDSQLSIDAFLPNPEEGEEWIRIVNVGEETACLDGWTLDDTPDGGSKPFSLPHEDLYSGETRMFGKTETKLSLNNKDDSVVLFDPSGEEVDRIDYGTTHKGEVFTHDGGDFAGTSKPKKSDSSSKEVPALNSSGRRFRFGRDPVAYAGELVNGVLVGTIEIVDQDSETLTLMTREGESKVLSYKSTGLDFDSLFLMLDEKELMQARVYESDDSLQLIDLEPYEATSIQNSSSSAKTAYLIFWLILLTAGVVPVFFLKKGLLLGA